MTMLEGQCHCGAVRYEMPVETGHRAICHCTDCRRHSGAPFVAWALVDRRALKVKGETREYASSKNGRRHFCPNCGIASFYTNAVPFPGKVDVQIATLDHPEDVRPEMQIQMAERVRWIDRLDQLPKFDAFPG